MADNNGPRLEITRNLKALGEGKTEYNFDKPNAKLLERFENPARRKGGQGPIQIDMIAPEFTSLCPKTGQPDFATIVFQYLADDWCVESKSLKLYLMSFRNYGSFHEEIVDTIGNDLVDLLDPYTMMVQGQFAPRGGIKFWPRFLYQKKQSIVPA